MHPLAHFHDPEELARVRALLRQKGVPTWANTIEGRVGVDESSLKAGRILAATPFATPPERRP